MKGLIRMRSILVVMAAILGLVVFPAAAAAATYNDTAVGAEIAATSTQGTFVGNATGDLPGAWRAVVQHTPLSPNATITGGSFRLVTTSLQLVVGTFNAGGTVTQLNPGAGCTDQTYLVQDPLSNVGVGGPGSGSGTFQILLTHFRANFPFIGCRTYSATVQGTLSLSF
jgi:hypothetical protein